MEIQHRDWYAELNRQLRHFYVRGVITIPDEQLADGAYLVPATVTLDKSALRNTDPTILDLELTVIQERKFPYKPPPQPTSWEARRYVPEAGPDEEAYTTVHIFYEGTCIQECRVQRFA